MGVTVIILSMTDNGKYIPFYSFLNDGEKRDVERGCKSLSFKKGESVNPNQDCRGFLVVKSGLLKAFSLSEDGREITLFRFFEHDLCIFTARCLLRDIDFSVNIIADEDTKCILIPTSIVDGIRRENINVSNYIASILSSHLSDMMWLLDQILNKRLDSRLAAYLVEESRIRGSLTITLTHEDIARHLGSRREVITRTLSYLEKEGDVDVKRGAIEILDFDRLSERAKDSLR